MQQQGKQVQQSARQEKRAAALRENLKRRRLQAQLQRVTTKTTESKKGD
jgi:hypothetical protein